MSSASDRKIAIMLIDEAISSGARQYKACDELNISERTYNRWKDPLTPLEDPRPDAIRSVPHNKLSKEERQEIVKLANSDDYKDLSPHQIVPRLVDEEARYIPSEPTLYRVLRERDMINHRGRTKKQKYEKHLLTKRLVQMKFGCGILLGFQAQQKAFIITYTSSSTYIVERL
jgi:putative transposase